MPDFTTDHQSRTTADSAGQRGSREGVQRRIDVLLYERGIFESRARARAAIEAGLVSVDGVAVTKPATMVPVAADLVAEAPHPWVSRGGVKLVAALDAFGIRPEGRICLDVGASTGGFTDVLLARGAARVYAVDVGRGQLHPRLAADPRVIAHEALDARALTDELLPDAMDVVTIDVSFISVRLVLPALAGVLAPGAEIVILVKPQFEAGRARIGRGGIVRDEAVRDEVVREIRGFVAALGLTEIGLIPSPIEGGDGNREYLLGARHAR